LRAVDAVHLDGVGAFAILLPVRTVGRIGDWRTIRLARYRPEGRNSTDGSVAWPPAATGYDLLQ
jgi:hypothetical protein